MRVPSFAWDIPRRGITRNTCKSTINTLGGLFHFPANDIGRLAPNAVESSQIFHFQGDFSRGEFQRSFVKPIALIAEVAYAIQVGMQSLWTRFCDSLKITEGSEKGRRHLIDVFIRILGRQDHHNDELVEILI